MKNVIWSIQAVIFYLFTLTFSLLPKSLVRPAGHLIGTMGFILIPARRHVAINNIRQSLPAMMKKSNWDFNSNTPEKITRQMFCHLGISLIETCRLYHGRGEDVLKHVEVRGEEHLVAARSRGKGVVVLTAHCGNWELAALALARHFNYPMSVVARRQNSPYLNSMVEKMRLRYGNFIIYKDHAFRGMMTVIRKNGIIGLLVDQTVLPEQGVLVDFLGRTAWASKSPVLLARKSGTAVVPAFIHRESDRHVIEIQPELVFSDDNSEQGIAANVQAYSSIIENFIANHPVDWYWVHRRWKRAGEFLTQ